MAKFACPFFLILILVSKAFPQTGQIKSEAMKEMQAGRYGEAIDLLNRYLSANPQESDGYNLRGICYEKRNLFEQAVYDFKSARKLKPNDKIINNNLSRASDSWFKILYNEIEGYKREIALNKNNPKNYLEIGKCYKNLGEWNTAEEWYDKYLKMEPASSDEIIRYTEILSKNNHISKGEPILKRYAEKYSSDHRLWSRYGYFTLWLGKIKLAINAFEKALQLRPFFKEALDGLNQAKGNGYFYTINDTSIKQKGNIKEYAIDLYYKEIKKNPELIDERYSLINELVKNNRIEEAFEQLLFLQKKEEGTSSRFKDVWDKVSFLRDSTYQFNIDKYSKIFEKDSSNKEAARKLAESYSYLYDYDNSIAVLEKYFENIPEEKDLDLRYLLAKYAAWSYQWEKAFKQTGILLKNQPDNLDYQFLMAQLISWNVLNADTADLEKAKQYLNNILMNDPGKLQTLKTMAILNAGMSDFEGANKYIDIIKKLYPESPELEAVLNYYNTRIEIDVERQILKIRESAGKLAEEGKCKEAVEKYKEVFLKTDNLSKEIYSEFASFCNCAGLYPEAVEAYTKSLDKEYDIEIASLRAWNRVLAGDSTYALSELQELNKKDSTNFAVIYNLGELYERTKDYTNAINLYTKSIQDSKNGGNFLDSVQISGLMTRISYLNNSDGNGLLFGGIGFSPNSNYYSDNQKFIYYNYGLKTDFNLYSGFLIGGSYTRHFLKSASQDRYLSIFSGALQFRKKNLYLSASMGQAITPGMNRNKIYSVIINYENKNVAGLFGSFEKNDARITLLSPNIINSDLSVKVFRINGYYNLKNNFSLSGYLGYCSISDKNISNDFQLRAGKSIFNSLRIGYEYYYTSYSFSTNLYYSPKNFEAHSIWSDYSLYKKENLKLSVGGKIGYVPSNDYILREIYAEGGYLPLPIITINAKITYGSSYRYSNSYNYLSAFLTAYYSIF